MQFIKRHKILCSVLLVIIIIGIVVGIWGYGVVQNVASPAFAQASEEDMVEPKTPNGSTLVPVTYMSEVIMTSDSSKTVPINTITGGWDDTWFNQSGYIYNHDLARFCILTCAMANGESLSYAGDLDETISEQTLEPLGFKDIDTSSYELASTTGDEINNLVKGETDQVACIFAHKTLSTIVDGQNEELVLVAVRGTYGTEWLSNFKVTMDNDFESNVHIGYLLTAANVLTGLQEYCWAHELDPSRVKLLITGHSRGASVAGAVASVAIDLSYLETDVFVPSPENVYAYCFATSPNVSDNEEARASRYAGIFNILDPTDLVTMLPAKEWGFTCWGTIGYLPGPNDSGFDSAYSLMDATRAYNTGYKSIKRYTEGGDNPAADLHDDIVAAMPDVESTTNPASIAKVVAAVTNYDMMRILSSHFPDTYIAWMQTLESKDIKWQDPSVLLESVGK